MSGNAGLFKAMVRAIRYKPAPVPTVRDRIVRWLRWGAANEPSIHYSEAAVRSSWLSFKPGKLPLTTDCSGFATLAYKWAGASDPNGLDYKQLGYTGTLLDHAQRAGVILTDVSKALPGDVIVIGPGTGDHAVTVVQAGSDPLVCSHGWEGGPVIQRLSVDQRVPKRVCRTLKP